MHVYTDEVLIQINSIPHGSNKNLRIGKMMDYPIPRNKLPCDVLFEESRTFCLYLLDVVRFAFYCRHYKKPCKI